MEKSPLKSYSYHAGYSGFTWDDKGYVSRNTWRNGEKYSSLTTLLGEETCKEFFKLEKELYLKDPNNIVMSYESKITESPKIDYAEYHILKRRQKTKNGNENPKSPCDDKGLPLYLDAAGNITTKSEGNIPVWGEWVDGSKEGVSVENITIRSGGRCNPSTIRNYNIYPRSVERADDLINRDELHHDKQQSKKKNKVQIEYKTELVKEETSQPEWECSLDLKKTKKYPKVWKNAIYNPRDNPLKYPITINLSWKENRNGRWIKTGAGNFKGRKKVTKEARNGRLFGRSALLSNIKSNGFDSKKGKHKLKVPGTDDYCVINESWSSYYDTSFGYIGQLNRLSVKKGPPYPIGGHDEFRWTDFSIQKAMRKLTSEEIEKTASHPSIDGEFFRKRAEKDLLYYKYKEKAPEEAVDFCFDIFNKVASDSIVEIGDDVPKLS